MHFILQTRNYDVFIKKYISLKCNIITSCYFTTDTIKDRNSTISTEADYSVKIRINQAIPSLSRRKAEIAIQQGRVTVNGTLPSLSTRISSLDIVMLDGVKQTPRFNDSILSIFPTKNTIQSEVIADIKKEEEEEEDEDEDELVDSNAAVNPVVSSTINNHTYIKMWKTLGITCTTATSDECNIISFGKFKSYGVTNRLFPVGRLDKYSTGIILLTSDGNFMNSSLGKKSQTMKVYDVCVIKDVSDYDLQYLADGVNITTSSTSGKVIANSTLPCHIYRNKSSDKRYVFIHLFMSFIWAKFT